MRTKKHVGVFIGFCSVGACSLLFAPDASKYIEDDLQICADGIDNDADGTADCNDPKCADFCGPAACGNGRLDPGEFCLEPARDVAVGFDPFSIEIADINADNHADILVANRDDLSVFLGNGTETLTRTSLSEGGGPFAITAGDVTRDNVVDLVLGYNRVLGNVTVLVGPSFTTEVQLPGDDSPRFVMVDDVDGDGDTDIVTANSSATVNLFFQDDSADGFSDKLVLPIASGSSSLVVTDFNRDGDKDILVANETADNVGVTLSNNAGSFLGEQTLATQDGALSFVRPFFIETADFDENGKPDFVVTKSFQQNTVDVLLNEGNGLVAATDFLIADSDPLCAAVGDLNVDGHTDIVVTNEGAGDLSIFIGNGDGTFQTQILFGVGQLNTSLIGCVALGDINEDTLPDIVVSVQGGATIRVIFSNP